MNARGLSVLALASMMSRDGGLMNEILDESRPLTLASGGMPMPVTGHKSRGRLYTGAPGATVNMSDRSYVVAKDGSFRRQY